MPDGKAIVAAYERAGNSFLAYRLEGMFRQLKTPEDVALHNALQREVMLMIGNDNKDKDSFYRMVEHGLLERDRKARWFFTKMVAKAITRSEE